MPEKLLNWKEITLNIITVMRRGEPLSGNMSRPGRSRWKKYFRIILFNFLFSNGDAHLKNFSLVENRDGDFLLSPAYDLLNTRLHISDSDFALERGLFYDDYKSERYKRTGHPSLEDFIEFAARLGISATRTDKLVKPFIIKQSLVEEMACRSFLDRKSRRTYLQEYFTRLNFLRG